MSADKQYFVLRDQRARQAAMRAITYAQDGMVAEVKPATRNLEQNAMLHALFGEIAKKHRYFGREISAQQWKTLFISGHAQATGNGVDMVAGLEGEFVNIRESSASMSIARMSSLIEYTLAWCEMNGIAVERPAAAGYAEMLETMR